MYKYKLFIDSIVLKIPYSSYDKEYDYNMFLQYLSLEGYKITNKVSEKYLNKFNAMYLLRNTYGMNLLDVYQIDNTEVDNRSIFFVYALKHGIYIEVNGLVQYEKDYRKEKYKLLHSIWNKYACMISKLDIALDIECKFSSLKVYNTKKSLLPKCEKSNVFVSYYCEGTAKNTNRPRKLKAYYKSTQRYREFPLALNLSRIELTLKSQKLKNLTGSEEFTQRINKELHKYIFKINREEINISSIEIKEMLNSLFSLLKIGVNTKKYSNYYKNIDIKVKFMKLAWISFRDTLLIKDFLKNNEISSTTLKKYRKFYKNNQV